MITSEDIIDHIGKMQAVSVEHLNKVSCMPEPEEQLNWAKRFFRVKQCFSNALQMSIVTECDLVVGHVFLREESLVFYQERKGVDYMALRRMPKYQHLFKINMI
ncbi:hypothetical protein NMS01_003520 [Vibrio cholerae]|nr:hypothetical protein [Vibrio cholerae]